MTRTVARLKKDLPVFETEGLDLREAALRVLRLPTVADKTFLITIGDRTVGGMTARDQMVGPWQVPVADVAVTLAGFQETCGEAFAMGERTPLALIDPAASGRMRSVRRSPILPQRRSTTSETSSSPPTGWRRPAIPGRMRRFTTRCGRWEWSYARSWVSASRWARTPCP